MNELQKEKESGLDKEMLLATREFCGFIAKYVSGPVEQGIGIFEDKLRYMRWERQVRLMQRAGYFLEERGLANPTRPVQLKVAIPLFQGASLEDDNELQDVWAKLLVNAADKDSGVTVQRAHITILENIGGLEMRILEKVYEVPEGNATRGIYTKYLPEKVLLQNPEEENLRPSPDVESVMAMPKPVIPFARANLRPSPEVEWAMDNLIRLGCLVSHMSVGGIPLLSVVHQTVLGRSLVKACSRPAT